MSDNITTMGYIRGWLSGGVMLDIFTVKQWLFILFGVGVLGYLRLLSVTQENNDILKKRKRGDE